MDYIDNLVRSYVTSMFDGDQNNLGVVHFRAQLVKQLEGIMSPGDRHDFAVKLDEILTEKYKQRGRSHPGIKSDEYILAIWAVREHLGTI